MTLRVYSDRLHECVCLIPPVRASYDAEKCEGKLTASTAMICPSLSSDGLIIKFPDRYPLDAKSWGAQTNEDDTVLAQYCRKLEVECMLYFALKSVYLLRETDSVQKVLSLGTNAARASVLKFCRLAHRGYTAKRTQLQVSLYLVNLAECC
jgi:hypothetical protein